MNNRIEKICLVVIRWASYIILFLPLLVYRETLYPYVFSKIIFFKVLVEIIFAAWLLLAVYNKKYRPNWKNPLIISLTIFIVVLFLTSLTGVDFQRSFWSSHERMTGVLTISHFWLWFIVLASTLKDKKSWLNLIWSNLICSFLVGLYGLGQKFGWSFVIDNDVSQLSSTLGNPIFLSVYAMMNVFLALILAILAKNKKLKILAIFLLFFNLVIMLWGASRGVFLAFSLSAFLFALFLLFKIRQKKIKWALSILLAVIVVFFILLPTQVDKEWMGKMPMVIRRTAGWQSSALERVETWQIAWQGFKDRPILGWGWENYNIIFNQYYQPQYFRLGLANTWFDHSHNQIMDFLSLTGFVGMFTYLFFYGSIFFLLLKRIKKHKQQFQDKFKKWNFIFVLLCLMLLAYFVQNLTVFDTPGPLIVFYFSLALIYFVTTNCSSGANQSCTDESNTNIPTDQNSKCKKFPFPILILIIIIFLPLTVYKFNIEPWQQSRLGLLGYSASQTDFGTSLYWYQESLAKPVFTNQAVRVYLAKTINEVYKNPQGKLDLLEAGVIFTMNELEKSVKEHPLDARYWLNLGKFYNLVGGRNKEYLDEAEEALQRAKELSPQRQEIYFSLVETKILKNDLETAIELAKKAVELDSEVGESHKVLGLTYLRNNNIEKGLAEIEEAEKTIDPYLDFSNALYIASSYFKLGNIERALFISELTRDRNPDNFQVFVHLAALYKEAGNKTWAINSIKRAVELNPSLAQSAEEFIKSLEND